MKMKTFLIGLFCCMNIFSGFQIGCHKVFFGLAHAENSMSIILNR